MAEDPGSAGNFLRVVQLGHRRVHQAGISISRSGLMDQLKKTKEIADYCSAQRSDKLEPGGRPPSERTLTRLDDKQRQIFQALDLGRFLAVPHIQTSLRTLRFQTRANPPFSRVWARIIKA
jgi:hypothetical protein